MMMECETYREHMSLWLDQQLTAQEIQQLEAHTAACPACRAVLEQLNQVNWLLASAPMMAPAPGFAVRFQARLTAHRRRRRTWAGVLTLALASLGILLGVTILLAISGLAVWEGIASSGLLARSVGLLLDMGKTGADMLKLAWLIMTALARGARHPVFIAYVAGTALLFATWTHIVARRVLVSGPVHVDARG
jgi:predicted anti-sigma-YlaC factor YlaD